ncbi:MAG TPA: ScyD/ScyE family protein, partial [Gemmatimonadaceae bacterium]
GAVVCAAVLMEPPVGAQPNVTVVMSGLDNPRGLAFGPEGALYVAEAGRGGDGPCFFNSAGETRCYGATGAITRWWRGEQVRIVTGLPSHASPGGALAGGVNDISFHGVGGMFVAMGIGNDPALVRPVVGTAGNILGTLLQVNAGGGWRIVADIAAYEAAVDPNGGLIDSNPFGVLAEAGSRLVVDAGANALFRVAADGTITTVAVFPSRPTRNTDSVPTAVAVGPDGAYYVGESTGAPFAAGAARIYRVVPGTEPTIHLEGFKMIVDLAFDIDGSLYVLQFATGPVFFSGPGELIRVAPDGTRSVVLGGLDFPTSVAVGEDGALYVTNHAVTPGVGEVLRITQ